MPILSHLSEILNTFLEKHFHDRTLQPLSEFNKTGEKEAGYSLGFQAEHWYGESDKATFMIKSVLNHSLTKKERQSKLEQFKKSFYRASEKILKLFEGLSGLRSQSIIDKQWQQVESGVCYDNLNVADFISEYIAGDLYKLFLYDKAPVIELVTNNNLPEKRFTDGSDKFKGCIEQEKNQDQLYLRSKFLDKFTTLMDLKEKGKNYQDAKGFEKILAAQTLLGEVDIAQPENFGVIEKEYKNAKDEKVKEKLWAKLTMAGHFASVLTTGVKFYYSILTLCAELK